MAFKIDNVALEEIPYTRDIRKLDFYLQYIKDNEIPLLINEGGTNIDAIRRSVYDYLKDPNIIRHNNFVKKMVCACKDRIFPKKKFKWIRENDRNCFWAWLYLRNSAFKWISDLAIRYQGLGYDYIDLGLHPSPSSTSERYDEIIKFFDKLEFDKKDKIMILNSMEHQLQFVYTFSRSFNWLKQNSLEQYQWAWEYIKNSKSSIFNCIIPTPRCTEERYLSIIALFDFWNVSAAEKELFLIKFKKAWSQKKYRDEMKDKKPLNVYISGDVKNKLDFLSKNNDKKIYEMIEIMVNKEYKEAILNK